MNKEEATAFLKWAAHDLQSPYHEAYSSKMTVRANIGEKLEDIAAYLETLPVAVDIPHRGKVT